MARSPIRTTHVGSLVRPDELIGLLERRIDGEAVDEQRFADVLEAAVGEVVARQHRLGIDIVNDGEYGKTSSWSQYVMERLGGFELRPAPQSGTATAIRGKDYRDFAEFYDEYEGELGVAGIGRKSLRPGRWAITGPIRYIGHAAIGADIERLQRAMAASGATEGFLPVVAPGSVVPSRDDEHYGDDEAALFAIAEAMREEYRAIVDAGLTLQVDDAYLASTYDLMVPPASLEEFRAWARVRIDALNHALEGIDASRVRYHVCWGSWNGPHTNDVAAADIIDLVLDVRAGGYSLEMANPRHEHEWRLWERVALPEGKVLLPGVISHSTNVVEHPELVAERLERLARLVGPERVVASTDCGFAQGPFARRVHPSIMWAKLDALCRGAELAAARL
ncbi:MAG: cobalamin-independent methionine synthase II family protein [Acidimicrobiales bacterium]